MKYILLRNLFIDQYISRHYHHLAHGFAHADQILFASGVLLFGYYLIFGLIIPLKFGSGITDMAFSVFGYPPIACVVSAQLIFTGISFLHLQDDLNEINYLQISRHVSFMRLNAMIQLKELLNEQGLKLSITLISAGKTLIIYDLERSFANSRFSLYSTR